MPNLKTLASIASLLALGATANAYATVVAFPNFSSTAGLTINYDAAITTTGDGDVLRLTPAQTLQRGSAFSTTTIHAANFSTAFSFRISSAGGDPIDCNPNGGADGFVFVVQNISASTGGFGAGIGYSGIGSSIGVEWDTWCNAANNDPNSNHLGIDVGGSVVHSGGDTAMVDTRFDDGNQWYGWVDYDGTTLEVRTNQTGIRPLNPMLTRALDIPALIGANTACVGFTSGTGSNWGNHDILAWEYRDSFNPIGNQTSVAEPATLALLATALPLLRRYRRS